MLRCSRAQVVTNLATVDFDDVAVFIHHGNDQRTVEMLMAALAVNAERLQARADLGTSETILLRQAQAQAAVGDAQAEGVDQFRTSRPGQTPRFQVGQRLRRLLQAPVVVVDDLAEQGPVVGVLRHRRGQRAHRAALHRFSG